MTEQLELFPTSVRIVRSDLSANMNRFYRIQLQPDLFGGCSLVREWGRVGSSGQVRADQYQSPGKAVDALLELLSAKQRRGYA